MSNSGTLTSRLLVILYAIAIVAIGSYPIQREYGSVYNYIKKKTSELLGGIDEGDNSWKIEVPRYVERTTVTPRRLVSSTRRKATREADIKLSEDEEQMDTHTARERTGLKNLLEDIE